MNQPVWDWLQSQQPVIGEDLVALANMNSGSYNLAGLSRVADWLMANMLIPGTEFESVGLPSISVIDDSGDPQEQSTGKALIWHCRPQAKRRILLAIHYDTVFGPGHSFQRCDWLSKTRLHGPGVADAKGGILVMRTALEAIERFGLGGDCGWTLLLNPDEEIGSPHSTELMARLAQDYSLGLLFEPALPTGELVSTRAGSGNYTVVVRGRAAHVGRHFAEGRNAIALLSWLFSELHNLNKRPGLTVNVGFVSGGGPVNVVPDLAVGRFNIRITDAGQQTWFEQQFSQLCDQINTQEGFALNTAGGVSSPPKPLTDASRRLMLAIEASYGRLGLPQPQWISTGGVCDGNKLAAAGLANIDTLGPVGGGLHSESEWVEVPSIVEKAKVVVDLIHSFSQGDFGLP